AVWPPSGVALAALLLCGGYVVPGIAAGAFIANLLNGSSAETAAAIMLGNTLAPVVAWLALRMALRRPLDISRAVDAVLLLLIGATVTVATVALVDILATIGGRGQFGGLPPVTSLVAVQAFNGAVCLTALVLAAISHQERRAQRRLRRAAIELEDRIEQRTAELRDARTAAEAANAGKDEFLSRMSHELRTPMTAILGFTELIGLGELDEQQ